MYNICISENFRIQDIELRICIPLIKPPYSEN